MLLDLTDIKNSTQASSELPPSQRSGVWKKRPELLLESNKLDERIGSLKKQVDKLFEIVKKSNKHVWTCLLDHERYMPEQISSYGMGSPEEAILTVQNEGRAWIETRDALEWVRRKVSAR